MMKIPTPFQVGDVNVYVLGDTLIDTGPKTPEAFDVFKKNVDLKSIKNVLITHGHVDHHGLAAKIKRISGADVFVHENDLSSVTDYEKRLARNAAIYRGFLEKAGISKRFFLLFYGYYLSLRKFGGSCDAEVFGNDFQTEMGRIEIIHTPGHTSGSCCFKLYDTIYSGDCLLPHISTNPSLNAVFDPGCGLALYRKSLSLLSSLKAKNILPGHGDRIENHVTRIKDILKEHMERKRKITGCLSENPQTLKEISLKVFGEVPSIEIILALAECYDHLRILEKEGIADIDEERDVYLFRIR